MPKFIASYLWQGASQALKDVEADNAEEAAKKLKAEQPFRDVFGMGTPEAILLTGRPENEGDVEENWHMEDFIQNTFLLNFETLKPIEGGKL